MVAGIPRNDGKSAFPFALFPLGSALLTIPTGGLPCIAIARTPAGPLGWPWLASPCVFPAGATAFATMAACCSSTCATITGSPSAWSIPIRRPSPRPRSCVRNSSSASTARCASGRPAPRIPTCRPASSRSMCARSRFWAPRATCRCRCSATSPTRKTRGSNTAFSTCAGKSCTRTSCCAGASSIPCARA